MGSWWRAIAEDIGTPSGVTGGWRRRVAVQLNRLTESGSWPRRIATNGGVGPDKGSWDVRAFGVYGAKSYFSPPVPPGTTRLSFDDPVNSQYVVLIIDEI